MKLRVALVALYPAPGAKAPGGVRAVVQNLVGALRAYTDLEIHVIHCHADIDASATVVNGNVRVDYIAMPRQRLIPNSLRSIRRVERRLREIRPDVVNTHAAHYTLAAVRAGYPTAFTIHGVVEREAEVYTDSWFDRSRFGLERWLERLAIRRVHDIVAISPYVQQYYAQRSRAWFHRIDNPLPNEFFAVPDVAEDGRLLYAGTIDERKNVLGLLGVLEIIRAEQPAARLRVAGRTTNAAYYRRVQEYVACHSLERSVQFLGLLDREALLDEYARCSVVVLASRQETAPMTVIEAMAAGKPVVATRVGGVPDLVEDGRSGFLVAPDDMEGLARSSLQVLTDAELRRSMGERGRELAQRFRADTVGAAYRDLYYQLAGRQAP
jgi:glycosyltransferase involved in cell wall biosynthesis